MNMLSKFQPVRLPRDPFFSNWPSIFEDTFFGKDFTNSVPAVNIRSDEKQWNIEVAAAGYRKEDFRVAVDHDLLTISADMKNEVSKEEKNYSRREFTTSSFSRSFRLNKDEVDEDNISANYENGILHIVIPKRSTSNNSAAREIRIG